MTNGPTAATKYTIPRFKVRIVRDGKIQLAARKGDCAENCAAVFKRSLARLPHEEMHALYLNTQYDIVGFTVLSVGGTAGTALLTSDVFRGAIMANAKAIVVAHNHPSGDPMPSVDDLKFTTAIRRAGNLLGIVLLDHLIVCPESDRWRSIIDLAAE